jgi:MFS family permease
MAAERRAGSAETLDLTPAGSDSLQAWFMVGAAFVSGFVVFGIIYSFGVFFEPIAIEFHASRAATSALFSMTSLMFYMVGSPTGHLSDRFGPQVVVGSGALAMGGGLILTALIDRMWIGYLTYGTGVGVGAACAYVPTLGVIGGWFVKGRNAALGIAAAGTGAGLLVMPPIAATLIERYGWRFTNLILGAGVTALLLLCALVVKRPPLTSASSNRSVSNVVRSFEFLMLYLSWIFTTTALFVPLVFLIPFAVEHGVSPLAASGLLSLLGGMSIAGRIGIGLLTRRIGTLSLFKGAVFVMGSIYVLWLTSAAYTGLMVFSAILGLSYGLRIALVPPVLIDFFGLQNIGAILGIFFTASGVSVILGPLISAAIVDYTGSYRWGIAFALTAGMLGYVTIAFLKERPRNN